MSAPEPPRQPRLIDTLARVGAAAARSLKRVSLELGGQAHGANQLLVFRGGDAITLTARGDARFMMLGGEPMDGPRHIWWNFVSSSKERIKAAKEDWKRARFDIVPGDEKEFIPLPPA